jgi:phosphoribosylformylglycinamidine synthase
MSQACRVLKTPVVSGNVSLYNETEGVSILPTPTVGMVGLLADVSRAVTHTFANEGDLVALLGETRDELGASEFLATVLGRDEGPCPVLDLLTVKNLVELLVELAEEGRLSSAHDISEGGLAVALAEASSGGFGADLNIQTALLATPFLFSQSTPRALVSFAPGGERPILEAAHRYEVPTALLGRVVKGRLRVAINGRATLDLATQEIRRIRESAFARMMEGAG